MYSGRIGLSERIGLTKSNNSTECIVCHYWLFNQDFKFQNSVYNCFHDFTKLCLNQSDIVIVIIIAIIDFFYIIHGISKCEVTHLLENSVFHDSAYISNKMYVKNRETYIKNRFYNHYFDNFVKAKKQNKNKTKN